MSAMGHHDLQLGPALFELHGLADRLAPGSEASTVRALEMVPALPPAPRVVDLGCGTGASSLALARALPDDAEIIAVDVHPPYIQRLRGRAKLAGLQDKIVPRVADMRSLGIRPGSVDLVWAEGSLYTVGFVHGCDLCRRLLGPRGAVAVSELVWRSDAPSEAARAYWAEHYPDMRRVEEILEGMQAHGYTAAGHFLLPDSDWRAYYDELESRRRAFAARRRDPVALTALELTRAEIELYELHGDEYGYAFFVASYHGGESDGESSSDASLDGARTA